jgi:protein O-GlcNAc transferase
MSIEARLAQAKAFHLAGEWAPARELYEQILADMPAHHDAMFRLAILSLQTGDANAALLWIVRARAHRPDEVRYRLAEGQILTAQGRIEDAVAVYRALLSQQPELTDAWFALATVLEASGDWKSAASAYESLLAREPEHIDALNNLGNCHRRGTALVAAEDAYRRALAVQPRYASALTNLATLIGARGERAEAIALLREAVAAEPGASAHLVNLGAALFAHGQLTEAQAVLTSALALDAHLPEAAYNLGTVLYALSRHAEAVVQYEAALALAPDHADAWNNLGLAREACGEFAAAVAAFEAALRCRPGFVAAHNNAGSLARKLGRMDDAEAHYRAALIHGEGRAAAPTMSATWNNLGNVLKDTGGLDEALISYRRALEHDPANLVAHCNLVYALPFSTDDGYAILEECRRLADRHEARFATAPVAHGNLRVRDKRLRIGYVSPDFRDHCQALFMMPLLAHHDHDACEIYCYSSVERPDALSAQLARHADVWRNVTHLDDEELANTIRGDGIDVLVDLTMHMAKGRPLLFARRPAPIQVAWLAYPGTTGSRAIDYRLTDPWLDPSGEPQGDDRYSERSIRLPDSFWCYDPLTDEPHVNELPALTGGRITFGCLNNPCKLNEHTLRMWAPVLAAVENSRLVLMAAAGHARERIEARASACGIDPARIEFVEFRPRAAYLETYHQIDLALDTFPYNGHTTSLDALWMGVPVVTRVGISPASRAGLSQLGNLGLTELVGQTDDEFVRRATGLARDLPRLARMRTGLRARMQVSPLMDGARFARHIEQAYRQMWLNTVGEPPSNQPDQPARR